MVLVSSADLSAPFGVESGACFRTTTLTAIGACLRAEIAQRMRLLPDSLCALTRLPSADHVDHHRIGGRGVGQGLAGIDEVVDEAFRLREHLEVDGAAAITP